VLGFESDIQWTSAKASASVALANTGLGFVPFSGVATSRLDWFGTTRGRLGFLAQPNFLLYGTGGFGYGSVNNSWNATFAPPANQIVNSSSESARLGWTAGAGVEWKVVSNWTIGAEYLHLDLGSRSFAATGAGSAGCTVLNCNFNVTNGAFRTDTVRIKANYEFGGPIVAKY
jgi:outer membrane immunogenic protein